MVRRSLVLALAALIVPACTRSSSRDDGTPPPAPPPVGTNVPPTVVLSAPAPDAVLQNGVAVDLEATASDPDGSVAVVEFFEGPNRLAAVDAPPFRFRWIPVIDGTFSLTATATDSTGAVTASDPVRVTVQTPGAPPDPAPPNQPPAVRIAAPTGGAVFAQGTSILLTAEASDPEGSSLVVEFFDGATSLGTDGSPPFQFLWAGASPGTHSVRAVATDAGGRSTTSSPVSITVSAAPAPPSSAPTGALNGVFFASPTRGWIVGEQGRIWTTGDGGLTWSLQNSGTSTFLSRVQFVSASVGWVVGVGGLILKTVDGGATWTGLPSGTGQNLRGLSFVSPSIGWVVGDEVILKTADGGATWTPQASGFFGGWFSVSFANQTTGWVGGTGKVLSTVDGGATWTEQAAFLDPEGIPRNIGLFDARFVSATRGVMVGATRAGDILRTTADGGATWATRENTAGTSGFAAVAFGDATHFWAVGTVGTIVASIDGGDTWVLQSSPTFIDLLGVWAVSASTAWAVGNNGTVLKTVDGGATWAVLHVGP